MSKEKIERKIKTMKIIYKKTTIKRMSIIFDI
jgi:hypothetical protein